MASSDTSGKRTCGNIHNGISILLEVQSSSFQTICPFPLRVLPFASGSRSTVRCLPLRIEARSKLSLSLPPSILFFPYFSSTNSFFLPAAPPWNRNSSAEEEKDRREKFGDRFPARPLCHPLIPLNFPHEERVFSTLVSRFSFSS